MLRQRQPGSPLGCITDEARKSTVFQTAMILYYPQENKAELWLATPRVTRPLEYRVQSSLNTLRPLFPDITFAVKYFRLSNPRWESAQL